MQTIDPHVPVNSPEVGVASINSDECVKIVSSSSLDRLATVGDSGQLTVLDKTVALWLCCIDRVRGYRVGNTSPV